MTRYQSSNIQKLIFSTVFQLAGVLNAQNDCQEIFDKEAIYLRKELGKGLTFVKEGRSGSVGFFYKNLNNEFDKTPKPKIV